MHDKDWGGVAITVLKEQTILRVVLHNSRYGISRLASDISEMLTDDMMVTITWDGESAKLYLNGKNRSESAYTNN